MPSARVAQDNRVVPNFPQTSKLQEKSHPMKLPSSFACIFSTLCLAACGSASPSEDAETETSYHALSGQWQSMVNCNKGAAILDVDTGERRNVQFVIRDQAAVGYISGTAGSKMHIDRGNGNEIVVPGWSSNGIFNAGDYRGSERTDTGYRTRLRAWREGQGIKVVFEKENGRSERQCVQYENDIDGSSYCAQWREGSTGYYGEVANWYFDRCF